MEQRTPQWNNWRKDKIGGSDASAIMGCGFISILELWGIKLDIRPPQEVTEAMQRGTDMEAEARACFESMAGIDMFPVCLTHPDYPWMICSLDGISLDHSQAVEIKCPGDKDHKEAKAGRVPEKYKPQLQHILAVAGLKEIFYFSYRSGEGIILVHERDDAYISKLIEKEAEFMRCLEEGKRTLEAYEDKMDSIKEDLCRIIENDSIEPMGTIRGTDTDGEPISQVRNEASSGEGRENSCHE